MQLRHVKTLHLPSELLEGKFQKITASVWSPNSYRFAVATVDRYITLYDEDGVQRDKFPTKPAEKDGPKTYTITGLAFSPDSTRLAVAQSDCIVYVYKLGATWADKKTICNKYPQPASVTALQWLASRPNDLFLATSDGKVKLGNAANKSITLYDANSYCTSLAASQSVASASALGSSQQQDNAAPLSILSSHVDGSVIKYTFASSAAAASLNDSTASQSTTTQGTQSLLAQLPFAVTALACSPTTTHVMACGVGAMIKVLDSATGAQLQTLDHSTSGNSASTNKDSSSTTMATMRDFTSVAFQPQGGTVVVGNYNCFLVLQLNTQSSKWQESNRIQVENMLSVTSLAWKADGSRLLVSSITGLTDAYEACLKRSSVARDWECTHTSACSVILKQLSTGVKHTLTAQSASSEIQHVKVYQSRFAVLHTNDTLILSDLQTARTSEVQWSYRASAAKTSKAKGNKTAAGAAAASSGEKFYFDTEHVVMIYVSGELSVVEFGSDTVIASARTEYMNRHLISVRVSDGRQGATPETSLAPVRKIAYLLDSQSVRCMSIAPSAHSQQQHYAQDLSGASAAASADSIVAHDSKIDWLELNSRGTKLLFRDKRRALWLYDLVAQEKHSLLAYCTYVQWVPDSDVIVAQSRQQLLIWYSIDNLANQTTIQIKGDVEQIERSGGKTSVVVDEGASHAIYALDEQLIAFQSSIDSHDFARAVHTLETVQSTATAVNSSNKGGNDALWLQLSKLALAQHQYAVAERCYAALGDRSKCAYIRRINALLASRDDNSAGGMIDVQHYKVRALVLQLHKQLKRAEAVLLQHNDIHSAIAMWRACHRFDEAIQVCERTQQPQTTLAALRQEYATYLLATHQEEVAGALKEKSGDFQEAIALYLRGRFPQRAARLLLAQRQLTADTSLCERVAGALQQGSHYDALGDFLAALQQPQQALQAYRQAHNYQRCIEVARQHYPQLVVALEEEFGDYLVSQQQLDAALMHYAQCGSHIKALQTATEARQWSKLQQILDSMGVGASQAENIRPYYRLLAQQYASSKDYTAAERCYAQCGASHDAVQMYLVAQQYKQAHALALQCMPPDRQQVQALFLQHAQHCIQLSKYKDAEQCYLLLGEYDLAITMYKQHGDYDSMLRLVGEYRSELLLDTYIHLAQQFQEQRLYKRAEQYFVLGKQWQMAAQMYLQLQQQEDALRVAKLHSGSVVAYNKFVYDLAQSLGGAQGQALLVQKGLADTAIDFACSKHDWPTAYALCAQLAPTGSTVQQSKLQAVHLAHAMALEDSGDFAQAEVEFIHARKPREAIDMHLHCADFAAAQRVAQQYEPLALGEVTEAHAKHCAKEKQFAQAEQLLLGLKKYEAIVEMYKDAGDLDAAMRIARQYVPKLVSQVTAAKTQHLATAAPSGSLESLVAQAKLLHAKSNYSPAIDAYLAIQVSHAPAGEQGGAMLQSLYETAVNLAMTHVKTRVQEVISIVTQRLTQLARHDAAAELWLAIDEYQKAIDIYLAAGEFTKAKGVAQNDAPHLSSLVDRAHQASLLQQGKGAQIAQVNVGMALETHAARHEWPRVYELCAAHPKPAERSELLAKYSALHAAALVKNGQFHGAAQIFNRYGAPVTPNNFPVYKRIAHEVLQSAGSAQTRKQEAKLGGTGGEAQPNAAVGGAQPKVEQVPGTQAYLDLRAMLFTLVKELSALDPNSANTREFAQLFLMTHLCCQRSSAIALDLKSLTAKLATSLLRYTVVVPADKAFYDAGDACRAADVRNHSFVFFNRFIDLCDRMSDPSTGDIDNTDFVRTDVPTPFEITLPPVQYYDEAKREEVRDWVLEKAMSADNQQTLQQRQCEQCKVQTFEAAIRCHQCQHAAEVCCVSGYPVLAAQKVQCKACNQPAIRDEWNKLVAKTKQCPWCQQAQNPFY